jgi:hypothetical protein
MRSRRHKPWVNAIDPSSNVQVAKLAGRDRTARSKVRLTLPMTRHAARTVALEHSISDCLIRAPRHENIPLRQGGPYSTVCHDATRCAVAAPATSAKPPRLHLGTDRFPLRPVLPTALMPIGYRFQHPRSWHPTWHSRSASRFTR